MFIIGCQINPLRSASTHVNPDAVRTKKLLLHKEQIKRLTGKVEQKGYTLVPINLHWKAGKVKCDIALAKGKAEHDKRDVIKDREGKREVERAMKNRQRRSFFGGAWNKPPRPGVHAVRRRASRAAVIHPPPA